MTQSSDGSSGAAGLLGVVGVAGGKRRKLCAEEKYQIFLEASQGDVSVAAVLPKWGIYSSDLAQIRAQVRKGALEALAWGYQFASGSGDACGTNVK